MNSVSNGNSNAEKHRLSAVDMSVLVLNRSCSYAAIIHHELYI